MSLVFDRLTVRKAFSLEGPGLHSGRPVMVKVLPGNDGIAFSQGGERWTATPNNITDTVRCTSLGTVGTIEHLMSAFAGLGITDAEVECTGGELPAAQGSALAYVSAIQEAGLEKIGVLRVTPPFARVFNKGDAHSIAIGSGRGHWRYDFLTAEGWPGKQSFEAMLCADVYREQIAPARTFVFEDELATIKIAGLGQGLDNTTALILGKMGYVNPSLFPDEAARHKLLDLIGDLYLSGIPIQAIDVIAERSGHTANIEAAAKLMAACKVERS